MYCPKIKRVELLQIKYNKSFHSGGLSNYFLSLNLKR